MVKQKSCTLKILVALVLGLLIGIFFMIIVQQNVFFRQPKPDDSTKVVPEETKTCTYQCQVGASSSMHGACPAGTTLLLAGRAKFEDVNQENDALLVNQMNALGFNIQGGTTNNGWNAQLEKKGPVVRYVCNAQAASTSSVTVTIPYSGACPNQETICPSGILKEPAPAGITFSANLDQARQEADANLQAQLDSCQEAMDKRCEQLPQDTAKRYWEVYEPSKAASEQLQKQAKRMCDRRGIQSPKEYTSDEKYDPLLTVGDPLGQHRAETIKAYLEALANPKEISKIKTFIEQDLAEKNTEVGGGLITEPSPTFKAYEPLHKTDNEGYSPGLDWMEDFNKGIVRSLWHIHAIAEDGNPSKEGPSGDPENPKTKNDDFSSPKSLTNGEVVITYIGKDTNGKICFNVKFFTKEGVVIDLGDYDP